MSSLPPTGSTWRKLREEPILDGEEPAFDRHGAIRWGNDPSRKRAILDSLNVSFWDPGNGQYVLFFRAYLPCLSRDGKSRLPETRSVMRATSRDFLNWGNIEPIEYGEPRREWKHSLYTSGLKPYPRAPHIVLGFPLRTAPRKPFHGTSYGLSETAFMYSRDTLNFVLVDEPFLRPGRDPRNWSKHGNLMAWGMLQTAPDELSFYYLQHDHQPGHLHSAGSAAGRRLPVAARRGLPGRNGHHPSSRLPGNPVGDQCRHRGGRRHPDRHSGRGYEATGSRV